MSEYLERTDAINPTFGDYVTLEMKCYGVPNEHFVHEVLSSPFISNSWREVPIKAGYFEEQLHDTSETVVAVRTQGVNPRDAHIFAVRLADVLPMKGTNWSWRESPLRSRIAELEEENDSLQSVWFADETICPDGSLKPKVSALLSRIAELEGKIEKAFDLIKALRMYCIQAEWDNPDAEDEFNEFDEEVCKWLSEFMESEE